MNAGMNIIVRAFAALLLWGSAATPTQASTTGTITKIVDLLAQAGVVDPALKDAVPLIDCLVKSSGNATACVDVTVAQKFVPDDPKVRAVVEIVRAADQGDWVTVIDVAGLKVLLPIACQAGVPPAGPLKGYVCQDAMAKIVAKVGEPAVRGILSALASGKPEVIAWKVITLAGNVDLACNLLPAFPGKEVPCGVLGKVLAEIGSALADAAKWGATIVVNVADTAENFFFGNDSHMPFDKYYALYWLPWLQYATIQCMADSANCAALDSQNEKVWQRCVDYFDSHNQYRTTAKKTCSNMRYNRFTPSARALAKAIVGAAEAQALKARPDARAWVVESGQGALTAGRKKLFEGSCQLEVRKAFPLPEGKDPATCAVIRKSPMYKLYQSLFDKLYAQCMGDVKQQAPEPDPAAVACKMAVPTLVAVVNEEEAALQKGMTRLFELGCKLPAGWSGAKGPVFECKGYVAYATCLDVMKGGNEKQHCVWLDPPTASISQQPTPHAAAGGTGAAAALAAGGATAATARTPNVAGVAPTPVPVDRGAGQAAPSVALPSTASSSALGARASVNPATARAQLPAVQSTLEARGAAVPPPPPGVQSRLPAVQSSPGGIAPAAAARAPDWGALPSPRSAPVAPSQRPAAMAGVGDTRATRALDPETARALSIASCMRVAGATGLDFNCSTPAGLERCEALKRQDKVDQCALTGRTR